MNMIERVEASIESGLKVALEKIIVQENSKITADELPNIEIEVPREKEHGDYATNLALVVSKLFKKPPREIASKLVQNFKSEFVEDVAVAGPGFINFKLNYNWLVTTVEKIRELGADYGKINLGQNKEVLIEFVSANPTGPLHVGHSRGAVVGDVLATILETVGYRVKKEYYINDAGNQIDILGKSVLIRYQQECGRDKEMPADYYAGDYLKEIARELQAEYGEKILDYSENKQQKLAREYTYRKMLKIIKNDLQAFGINFDNWFSEKTLHKGKIKQAVDFLKEKGYIYTKEGAVWFKATEFGDDKDRVVFKYEGTPTYLAADIAYHYDKLQRGYDQLINIWGADHHGYISRIKAVIAAFGYRPDILEVIIVQMVTLLREGKKVSMSKRSGEFVTMRDVLREVGRDAARYFYIMRSADSHFDFDLDLAREQSSNNPVYYIQYAHARIHSILEKADSQNDAQRDLSLLTTNEEVDLMKLLARYPQVIKISAINRQVHHLTAYAYDLANAFHIFYNKCRVITADRNLSVSRIYLIKAIRQVLRNVLNLLGISAPCEM